MHSLSHQPYKQNQLYLRIIRQLGNNKNIAQGSLFNKLQLYDKIVLEMKINRNSAQAMEAFQHIINEQGNSYLYTDNTGLQKYDNFNSPPQNKLNKKYEIQDPQQFSFSKTRPNVTNLQKVRSQRPTNKNQFIQKQFVSYSQKIKAINNSYPQHKENKSKRPRRISEFICDDNIKKQSSKNSIISENDNQQNKEESKQKQSMHNCLIKLEHWLKREAIREFRYITMGKIQARKLKLKMKSAQYIHQLRLLQKAYYGLIDYKKFVKTQLENYLELKKVRSVQECFYGLKQYAFRSQEDRQLELIQRNKTKNIIKLINIRKFIKNSALPASKNSANKQIKTQHLKNIEILYKKIGVRKLRQFHQNKQSMQTKIKKLKGVIIINQGKVMWRLLKWYREMIVSKQNKGIEIVKARVWGVKILNNIRDQLHFQRAYWQQSPKSIQLFETTQQLPVSSSFTPPQKYKKILFINMFLTASQQSLYRQGYFLQQNIFTSSPQYTSHPAIINYLQPHTMHKFFTALKKLTIQNKNKQQTIKSTIIAKNRIIQPMLNWYRQVIVNKLQQEYLQLRSQELMQYLTYGYSKNIIAQFQRFHSWRWSHEKIQKLEMYVKVERSRTAIKILQSYKISKRYYVDRIRKFRRRCDSRTQQTVFLEWKLFNCRKIHMNYLTISTLQMRKSINFQLFCHKARQHNLNAAIFHKRVTWLTKNRIRRQGQTFLINLHQNNKYNANKNSSTFQQNLKTLTRKILQKHTPQFYSNLKHHHEVIQIYRNLYTKDMPQFYENKLKNKVMMCLLEIRRANREERANVSQIRGMCNKGRKREVMGVMVGRLLEAMVIKRMCRVIGRQGKIVVMDAIMDWEAKKQEIDNIQLEHNAEAIKQQ